MRAHELSRPACVAVVAFLLSVCPAGGAASAFVRGDVDQSGGVDLSDPINVLLYLFAGDETAQACLSAADVNDSGAVNLADALYALNYLFAGGPPPPPPFPECGADPTPDDLSCLTFEPCGTPGHGELLRGKARNINPAVDPDDLAAVVRGMTEFACDLYKQIDSQDGNLFFSPYSVSVALAMLYAGARGRTETEMARALHFAVPQERLHPAFNALDLALASRGEGAQGRDGEGFRLNIANGLWCQYDYSFLQSYLDIVGENYGAGVRLLDFKTAPEPSRRIINEWVAKKTEGRIRDLLPQGSITILTRLVITNAVYFNAAWKTPFDPDSTRDGAFHLLDGSIVTVPLMSGRLDCGVARGAEYTAVELPYDGDELSMIIIVPAPGTFKEFESSLGADRLQSIVESIRASEVILTMPKFTFRRKLDLKGALSALGMSSAFVPNEADFSGIDGTRSLFVSDVVHQAFCLVDEAGTEAAAATGVVVGVTSVPPEIRIDRPFVFFIRDKPTGAIIFFGRVLDPR